ncbi:MAG: hypothetical protein K2X68_11460, partial [Novosphingobium sp.]|nr:hypothetical protein [Novosphingobium sp.]
MIENSASLPTDWDDDDLPEWTDEQFARAQFSICGKVMRPANGTLTRPGRPGAVFLVVERAAIEAEAAAAD